MSLRPYLKLVEDILPAVPDGAVARARKTVAISVPDAATAIVAAALWDRLRRPLFLVTPHPETARRIVDQLPVWCGDDAPVFHFAESEVLPFERLIPDSPAIHARLRALAALAAWLPSSASEADSSVPLGAGSSPAHAGEGTIRSHPRPLPTGEGSDRPASSTSMGEDEAEGGRAARPPIVVSSVSAANRLVLDPEAFRAASHTVRTGASHNLEKLVERWVAMGYEMKPSVEGPGTASRRGGILDIFPITDDDPSRIEFFGDEVESIRRFDPETQRSTVATGEVTVVPARITLPGLASHEEAQRLAGRLDFGTCEPESFERISAELGQLLRGEVPDWLAFYSGFFDRSSVFDYLSADALVVVLRAAEVEDVSKHADERLGEHRLAKERRGEIPRHYPQPHLEWGFLSDALKAHGPAVAISPWGIDDLEWAGPGGAVRLPFAPAPVTGGRAERLWEWLQDPPNRSGRVLVLTQHAERVRELAVEHGIGLAMPEHLGLPPAGSVVVEEGSLRKGFTLAPAEAPPFTLFTDSELFGVSRERRPVQRRYRRRAAQLKDLQPGAYLVHIEHGIGRFIEIVILDEQSKREYLLLDYAEGDKLYVPMDQLDRLTPYHGGGDDPPKLTRLGTQEWVRAKARARRATEQLAAELLALYAARAATPGFIARPDSPWQDQLEASFPYEETPDQMTTIAEVKKDLEAGHPMDRLVCGDVGYGKTEVAIRAAFKVVQSGRQAAVLVPTTVLAQQHLATFRERLGAFPVTVEALSRLRSDQEQQSTLEKIASGELDVVIGTHRLLQRDVHFKDLGLVVIDEEHRFGVVHKERLKRMRKEVDVLAMSATPIPRTLYLSLSGIRDMSPIDTPPEDRLPIKTYVSEESDELVREAILRELDRGGQIFFLHNRVKTIEYVTDRLIKLVPEARFEFGHGQMPEDELERVMMEFGEHKFDVLVCTTIIESGLDLPNVNTLIVDRSDRFGLAQLYQ
ncbi:MAG: DEAD/DEAH box helicase, partial [Chloroflexi bacterium]|nr:DEAD/DEAH box helicase [Chloroflexota bacterium]